MDRYDQELLERQMRAIYQPPRHTGGIILAILAIFLCGMIAGSVLSATNSTVVALLDRDAQVTPR